MGARVEERIIELAGRGKIWIRDQSGPSNHSPAVLLLHGLGVTARFNWHASYDVLASEFRVLALDHRGHGRGIRARRFSLEDCADDAILVTEALGIERVVIVGYSLGGPIALLAWRRHPCRVAGLVLAATAARFGRTRRARFSRMLLPAVSLLSHADPDRFRDLLFRRALQRVRDDISPSEIREELRGHHPPNLVQAVRAAWAFAPDAWLHEVSVPVSVLVTAEDDRVSPEDQRELARRIPGARSFEVPGNHTACVTRADAFAPALLTACRDAWAPDLDRGRPALACEPFDDPSSNIRVS